MKVLVFGNGWIGKMIQKELEKNHQVVMSNERAEVANVSGFDRVVCSIGRTHGVRNGKDYSTIDYLESKDRLKENINDNLYAPFYLANQCREKGIHMTYLGTGCIFSGFDKKYKEDDVSDFFGSSYSVVKGFTDKIIKTFPNVLNVRIRMPISSDNSSRNLLEKLKKYKKVCSIPNSVTVLDDLIPVMCKMLLEGETGTINLVNPGTIEHKDILDMINVKPEYINYQDQLKLLESERSNNQLDTTLLESKYGPFDKVYYSVFRCLSKNMGVYSDQVENQLKLNPDKCVIFDDRIEFYFGSKVSIQKIEKK